MGAHLRIGVVAAFVVALAGSAQKPQPPPSQPGPAAGRVESMPPTDAGVGEGSSDLEADAAKGDVYDRLRELDDGSRDMRSCLTAWRGSAQVQICARSRARCNGRREEARASGNFWAVGACEPEDQSHEGVASDTGEIDAANLDEVSLDDYDPKLRLCQRGCLCGRTCIDCAKMWQIDHHSPEGGRAIEPPPKPWTPPASSWSPSGSGPVCKRGCRCGNSCISCSKRCHK